MTNPISTEIGKLKALIWLLAAIALASVLAGCQTAQTWRTGGTPVVTPTRYCVTAYGEVYGVPITPQSRCGGTDFEFSDKGSADARGASIRAAIYGNTRGPTSSPASSPTSAPNSVAQRFCVTPQGTVYVIERTATSICLRDEFSFETREAAYQVADAIWRQRQTGAQTNQPSPTPSALQQRTPSSTAAAPSGASSSAPQAVSPGQRQSEPRQPVTRTPSTTNTQQAQAATPRAATPSRSAPPQQTSSPPPDAPAPQNSSPAQVAQTPAPRVAPQPTRARVSMGSSFTISADGVIVTNHHVVEDCLRPNASPEVSINGEWIAARVLGFSQRDDLAILRVNAQERELPHLPRSGKQMRLGEPVYAFGYPLSNLLAEGGNFSQGMVSAMAGLLNDPRHLQISVPVQQGNSGGPLVDETGAFVGVITSKLNAVRVAQFTGDIPQNVNFAVKGSVLMNLLETLSVSLPPQSNLAPQSAPEIAQHVSAATHKVRCRN